MFTPQGKGWIGWSTPAPANQCSGGGPPAASAPLDKGKGTSKRVVELEQEDGDKFWWMPECYIRGNTIKYLRVPDEAKRLASGKSGVRPISTGAA